MRRRAGDERAGELSVAKDRDAVGDRHHLVDVMRDEDDAGAGRGDGADEAEQLLDALARQERRRLVEEHEAGPAGGGAGDADFLEGAHDGEQRPLDRAQAVDALFRVDGKAEAVERLAGRRPFAPPVDEAALRSRQMGEAEIFEHGQRRHETEILVHEAHAETAEVAGLQRQIDRLAVEVEPPAGIGRMEAGQNLDERRLAGAVLAEQAMHLAGRDAERDPRQRTRAAEGLGDPIELQNGKRHGRLPLVDGREVDGHRPYCSFQSLRKPST